MSQPATTPQSIDTGGFGELTLRDISGDAEIERAAQLLAGHRPPERTTANDENARFFWRARLATCAAQGLAIGVFQTGSEAPQAVVCALIDNMHSDRVVVADQGYVLFPPEDNRAANVNSALAGAVRAWSTNLGRYPGVYEYQTQLIPTRVRVWVSL